MQTEKQTTQNPSSSDREQVRIFDTTLRDGEQSPGASMSLEEKLQIAQLLDEMKVDIIEAGFPIASNGDFEAVSEIAKKVKYSTVCGLARASKGDIDRAAEALIHSERRRIHTFISTSPLHMKFKLQLEPEDVYEKVIESVKRARSHTDDVEWSPEDGTRTEHDFLCRCVEAAIDSGATTINIPDTVGYTVPEEYYKLIEMLKSRVPNIDKAVLSVHCHNDLGMAVANSLAGVKAGARQIECTINGIGERAGNAALEELVMAIRTRVDVMPFYTNIDTPMLMQTSKMVSTASSFPVQFNKAIVGKNAFAHESGIHQDGMLKNAETYEIMRPEDVGVKQTSLVMGKHSGRHAFKQKLESLGFDLGDNAIEEAFHRFKELADRKKFIYDEDIAALAESEIIQHNERIKLVSMFVVAGTSGPQDAKVTLEVDGEQIATESSGDGPVDAIFNCVKSITKHPGKLTQYLVNAISHGTDAQAEVTVQLEHEGQISIGKGSDTNTLVASTRAYVTAVNKLVYREKRYTPENSQEVATAKQA